MLLNLWLDAIASGELAYRESSFENFRSWLEELSIDAEAVDASDFQRYLKRLALDGFSPSSVERIGAYVRSLYRWSWKSGHLAQMPMEDRPAFDHARQASPLTRRDIESVIDALLQLCRTEGRGEHWNTLDARRSLVISLIFYWGIRPQSLVEIRMGLLYEEPDVLKPLGVELFDDEDPASRRFRASVAEYRHWLRNNEKARRDGYAFFALRGPHDAGTRPTGTHSIIQNLRVGAKDVGFARYEAFTAKHLLQAHFDVFRSAENVVHAERARFTLEDRIPAFVPPEMVIDLLKLHPRHELSEETVPMGEHSSTP